MTSVLGDDDSVDLDDDAGNQLSLEDFVKSADRPEDKAWAVLTIDAFCSPADLKYMTDLK